MYKWGVIDEICILNSLNRHSSSSYQIVWKHNQLFEEENTWHVIDPDG